MQVLYEDDWGSVGGEVRNSVTSETKEVTIKRDSLEHKILLPRKKDRLMQVVCEWIDAVLETKWQTCCDENYFKKDKGSDERRGGSLEEMIPTAMKKNKIYKLMEVAYEDDWGNIRHEVNSSDESFVKKKKVTRREVQSWNDISIKEEMETYRSSMKATEAVLETE